MMTPVASDDLGKQLRCPPSEDRHGEFRSHATSFFLPKQATA